MRTLILSTLAIVMALVSGAGHAASPKKQKLIDVSFGLPVIDEGRLLDIQTEMYLIGYSAQRTTSGVSGQSVIGPAAAAPPLTYLQISAVGSSLVGWEVFNNTYQTITDYDHGGSQMRVETVELGYGSNRVAKVNGGVLPSSANYLTINICQDIYGQLNTTCSAGQVIVGFFRYWNLDGYQNAYFTYQNTSTNSPWNTMSDAMSIR
jgi:hypothetical protein